MPDKQDAGNQWIAGSGVRLRKYPDRLRWNCERPIRRQTVVEYVHTDALGTPVAITNTAGTVIERSEYEPYGQLINRPLTDGPGFTGHVQDAATGLTYMQQRYYDPAIGRFLSVDPVTANSGTGSNFNRYWYAGNNPYKFTDPDGRMICNRSSVGMQNCQNDLFKPQREMPNWDERHALQNGRNNKDGKSTHSKKESPITTLETTTVRPEQIDRMANKYGSGCSFSGMLSACGGGAPDYIKGSVSSYLFSGSFAATRNGTIFSGGSVGGSAKSMVSVKPSLSFTMGYLTSPGTATDVDNVVRGASTSFGFYYVVGGAYSMSDSGNAVEFGTGSPGPAVQAVEYMHQVYPSGNGQ